MTGDSVLYQASANSTEIHPISSWFLALLTSSSSLRMCISSSLVSSCTQGNDSVQQVSATHGAAAPRSPVSLRHNQLGSLHLCASILLVIVTPHQSLVHITAA